MKAQVAVETLLIYGVTILIVMLAIGALIGFGVIDLGRLLPDQCEIANAFSCENYVVSPSKVQLELRNILGKNIAAYNVSIIGEGDNEGLWNCEKNISNEVLVNGVISDPKALSCDIKVPAGKKIMGSIFIEYLTVGSKITQTASGNIRATVS